MTLGPDYEKSVDCSHCGSNNTYYWSEGEVKCDDCKQITITCDLPDPDEKHDDIND